MSLRIKRNPGAWIGAILLPSLVFLASPAVAQEGDDKALFAKVNGEEILLSRYSSELRKRFEETFYHGRPPEGEINSFQLQVGHDLINDALLAQEADKRGIAADEEKVKERLDRQIERYSSHPEWEKEKESAIEYLTGELRKRSKIRRLEMQVREEVVDPTDAQLQAFYQANKDKFTTPVRERVSILLVKVQPWEGTETWEKAMNKAKQYEFQLKEGADFAEMAKQYSEDSSAAQGGDMGYLHQGMLGGTIQGVISKLKKGEMSEPIRVLEGVAIVRLEDREEAKLNPIEVVKERATSLWRTEERERVFKQFVEDLRKRSQIEIVASEYLDLPGATKTGMSKDAE